MALYPDTINEKTQCFPQAQPQLGRYHLMHALKYGGMSTIYLAYDECTQQAVVVKAIEREQMSLRRFQRETWIMRSCSHPNILPLLDAGADMAFFYLVMPSIERGSLEDRLQAQPLSLQEAVHILQQIASALQYLHNQGFLHGDIKPSNILVDLNLHAYLTDFGLATIQDEEIVPKGQVMGTAHYIAPEILVGEKASVSQDVYALGVTLYQMLTGSVPFDGPTSLAVCLKQVNETPEAPSRRNPVLSHAIDAVILHALQKDPQKRFLTVQTLADALIEATTRLTFFERVQVLFKSIFILGCS